MQTQIDFNQPPAPIRLVFDGSDYTPCFDEERLTGQFKRIFTLMKDGKFRTLSEIASVTGDHEASVSAQLRHAKKPRFGGHTLNKQRRGEPKNGLWEYQLVVTKNNTSHY